MARTLDRSRALERVRVRLLRRRMPRLQMGLIVVLTGLAAFLFSFVLLRAGVVVMAVRYPLAAILAYGVFLAQLRWWLRIVRRRSQVEVNLDLLDLTELVPDLPGLGLDEAFIVVVPVLVAFAGAAAYVVYSAPVLFAELIVDGIIVTRLYRRFRDVPPEGWLTVALRHTWVPLLVLLVVLGVTGFAAERVAPGADSIGDVLRPAAADR